MDLTDSDDDLDLSDLYDLPSPDSPAPFVAQPQYGGNSTEQPKTAPDLAAQLQQLKEQLLEKQGENAILSAQLLELNKKVSLSQSRAHQESLRNPSEDVIRELEALKTERQILTNDLKVARARAAAVASLGSVTPPATLAPSQSPAVRQQFAGVATPTPATSTRNDGFVQKRLRSAPKEASGTGYRSNILRPDENGVAVSIVMDLFEKHKAPGSTKLTMDLLYTVNFRESTLASHLQSMRTQPPCRIFEVIVASASTAEVTLCPALISLGYELLAACSFDLETEVPALEHGLELLQELVVHWLEYEPLPALLRQSFRDSFRATTAAQISAVLYGLDILTVFPANLSHSFVSHTTGDRLASVATRGLRAVFAAVCAGKTVGSEPASLVRQLLADTLLTKPLFSQVPVELVFGGVMDLRGSHFAGLLKVDDGLVKLKTQPKQELDRLVQRLDDIYCDLKSAFVNCLAALGPNHSSTMRILTILAGEIDSAPSPARSKLMDTSISFLWHADQEIRTALAATELFQACVGLIANAPEGIVSRSAAERAHNIFTSYQNPEEEEAVAETLGLWP